VGIIGPLQERNAKTKIENTAAMRNIINLFKHYLIKFIDLIYLLCLLSTYYMNTNICCAGKGTEI